LILAKVEAQLEKATQEIAPRTNKIPLNSRLIERTAQIYGFGDGVKIERNFVNSSGKTMLDYGKNVVLQYRSENAK
jgi:hypothetical protein